MAMRYGKNHVRARDLALRLREMANVTLPFYVSRIMTLALTCLILRVSIKPFCDSLR